MVNNNKTIKGVEGGITVAKSPHKILQEIASPKNGPQGKVLSQEELNVLGSYLKQSGNDSLRGTVVKSYGGGQDVVFGTIKDRMWKGSTEYLVMNDSGAGKGMFRLHSTPISKSDIVSSPTQATNSIFGDVMGQLNNLVLQAHDLTVKYKTVTPNPDECENCGTELTEAETETRGDINTESVTYCPCGATYTV